MAEKLTAIDLTQSTDQVTMKKIKETFNQHLTLMEALNKKSDAQSNAIVENRKILQEKVRELSNDVTRELENATKYLDLKSYDMSIEKIEKDVAHFFKELA